MKTAKLGAIFLISLMALAGAGVGYAAWFDTITVTGTVNTGSVGWDVVGYSGTWVFKNLATDGIVIQEHPLTVSNQYLLVASSYATQTIGADNEPVDDSVTVVFNNIFPCIDFEADITIHYTGSVPGKINGIYFRDLWPETDDEIKIDQFTTLDITITHADGTVEIIDPDQLYGYQLHYCDHIYIVMTIHLPQYYENGTPTDDLMGLTGSFDLDVEVVQWNEHPYTHP